MSTYTQSFGSYLQSFVYNREPPPLPPSPPSPPRSISSFEEFLEPVKENLGTFLAHAEKCNETQFKVIGVARTAFDVMEISQAASLVVAGALIAIAVDTVVPDASKKACEGVDKFVESAWRILNFQAKLICLIACLIFGMTPYFGIPILRELSFFAACLYSIKRGADLGVQYKESEERLNGQRALSYQDAGKKIASD